MGLAEAARSFEAARTAAVARNSATVKNFVERSFLVHHCSLEVGTAAGFLEIGLLVLVRGTGSVAGRIRFAVVHPRNFSSRLAWLPSALPAVRRTEFLRRIRPPSPESPGGTLHLPLRTHRRILEALLLRRRRGVWTGLGTLVLASLGGWLGPSRRIAT